MYVQYKHDYPYTLQKLVICVNSRMDIVRKILNAQTTQAKRCCVP